LFAYKPTPTDMGLNPGSAMRHRGLMPELCHGPCRKVWVGCRSVWVPTFRRILRVPYHVHTERVPRYRLLPVEWSELLNRWVLPSAPDPEVGCHDSCFLDVLSVFWQMNW
jgi:hypothetical protein